MKINSSTAVDRSLITHLLFPLSASDIVSYTDLNMKSFKWFRWYYISGLRFFFCSRCTTKPIETRMGRSGFISSTGATKFKDIKTVNPLTRSTITSTQASFIIKLIEHYFLICITFTINVLWTLYMFKLMKEINNY